MRPTRQGGIEWTDATYSEGKAAKWKASGSLRVLMYQYNNTPCKLYGSKPVDIESLWSEMPSQNIQNVGLRPVRSVHRVENLILADCLDRFEALGLTWMAA